MTTGLLTYQDLHSTARIMIIEWVSLIYKHPGTFHEYSHKWEMVPEDSLGEEFDQRRTYEQIPRSHPKEANGYAKEGQIYW